MTETAYVRPHEPATRVPAAPREPDSCDDHGESRNIAYPALWNKTIEILCDRPNAFRIQSRSIAETALAEISSPPVTVTQNNVAAGDPHRYHLILLLEGHGRYAWMNGAVTQSPGDIVLIDTAEWSQVISPVETRLVRWSFPEALVAPFLPQRDSDAILHLPASNGLNTVLMRHTRELAREAERLDHATQHGVLAHLCGLLGLALEAAARPRQARTSNYRTFQRQRVLTYIETHLADPRLTAGRAAKDLGISPRWLHALLEDMAAGFCELVACRRLKRSRMLLEDPASDNLSIAEIAFLSGFNDLSTFYRRFGERYGITPGAARRTRNSFEQR
ncbi:helix-turn-helix domain-containing protein [Chelativorans sp. YIM 93263]|uniref:helix-turn-helix domain-containing protein n=1 Tax=Chelativorans sp. YIM 93263 TaxID=2906648 RepID=UPI00237810BC|nr:helix-turn-helix domain-containing protein [Chelativorans sp. YIM 93263]